MQVDLYYDHQTVVVVAVSKSLSLLTKHEHCIRTATVIAAHNGKHKTHRKTIIRVQSLKRQQGSKEFLYKL